MTRAGVDQLRAAGRDLERAADAANAQEMNGVESGEKSITAALEMQAAAGAALMLTDFDETTAQAT